MSDMIGAVRSNTFKVKDVKAFTDWFNENVKFGEEVQLWPNSTDTGMSFGGYEQYPNAYPRRYEGNVEEDADSVEVVEWDLEEFATEIRKHLLPGEEFRVLAGGHEKLRYVSFTHLIITHETAVFNNYYEGN